LAGIAGTVLLFGFFLNLLAGIIGIGFILLIASAVISVAERLSGRTKEKTKGR